MSGGGPGTCRPMFMVEVACSGCPEDDEVVVASLDEIEALFCECDCGWVVVSVSEVAEF